MLDPDASGHRIRTIKGNGNAYQKAEMGIPVLLSVPGSSYGVMRMWTGWRDTSRITVVPYHPAAYCAPLAGSLGGGMTTSCLATSCSGIVFVFLLRR